MVAVEVVGLLATFFVFVDVVLIGETACYVRTEGFVWATVCYGLLMITS